MKKVYKIVRRLPNGARVSYTACGEYRAVYQEGSTTRKTNLFVFDSLIHAQEELSRAKPGPFEIWECETPETRPAPKFVPAPEYTDPTYPALYNPYAVVHFWLTQEILVMYTNMTSEGALLCNELTLIRCIQRGAQAA